MTAQKFRKKPVVIEAFQWIRHELGKPENDTVRYFRRPNIGGEELCTVCDVRVHEQG